MPVCPECNTQQPDGAHFCDECGTKLAEPTPEATSLPAAQPTADAAAVPAPAAAPEAQPSPSAGPSTCSVCGGAVAPGESFCNNCGAAVGQHVPGPQAQAAPPSQATPAPLPGVEATAAPSTCPNCGVRLEPGSYFCDMCGASIGTTMPPFPVPAAEAAYPAPGPAPPPSSFASGPAIPGRLTIQGTNVSLPFPQGKQQVFIGREDPVSGVFPEIDLTNYGGDEGGVSRSHARIFSHGNQVFIEDLNSVNYTFVNQQRLMPGQAHVLNSGDELRFGRVALNYYV